MSGSATASMSTSSVLLLVLDLAGTFVFALNGALTAIRAARLDIVGVVALGMFTAMGGGIIRDVLIGSLPPATFSDWRYLVVAAVGALLAFFLGPRFDRIALSINIFDAMGLSLFAVTGSLKALDSGMAPLPAVLLGAITGVGGGTLRDVLLGHVPTVLTSGLYAIPALVGATALVTAHELGVQGLVGALVAAGLCFGIRVVGIRYDLNAPAPRGRPPG
ncbi:trimeric intracellular cation channel family protein [Intrasporangium sp. YIM S08009]|uniref:trimeric intracellular cation channel family protein n=1 Tax=Intrasporangium zincisolvens TaxID=3080018 RepID=UPI002B05D105|nr:trimeric intracellular cation channel family protein [Intrasporangium sp. YIM S08009]